MLSFKRIMAVCLMVLISNVYASGNLAKVDGPANLGTLVPLTG